MFLNFFKKFLKAIAIACLKNEFETHTTH